MELNIYKEVEELIHVLAENIQKVSQEAIAAQGRFNFVLSGGNSPRKLYEILASKKFKKQDRLGQNLFFLRR